MSTREKIKKRLERAKRRVAWARMWSGRPSTWLLAWWYGFIGKGSME